MASPSSSTARPDSEPKPTEVIAKDSAQPVDSSEFALATATGGPCGPETNANTTSSTSGVLGLEYLSGEGDGTPVADNPTDDQRSEAGRR